MKLTSNGIKFFNSFESETFQDSDILEYGVTSEDLYELMDYDYINYDEETDQFYWTFVNKT